MSRNLRLATGLRVAPRAVPVGARSVSTTPGEPAPAAAAGPSTAASTSASPAPSHAANGPRTTHFGFQTVPEEQKESLGKLKSEHGS